MEQENPSISMLGKIAEGLNVTVSALVDEDYKNSCMDVDYESMWNELKSYFQKAKDKAEENQGFTWNLIYMGLLEEMKKIEESNIK
jgi:transcriptional regulator with XRE-family HTH domain